MICIYCRNRKTEVNNSRPNARLSRVWRRRTCPNCHNVFSTEEVPNMTDTYIIDDEHTHVSSSYSRSKLLVSILPAMTTINESSRFTDLDALMDTIEHKMTLAAHDAVISKDDLASTAYEVLKAYDAVTGLQYGVQHGLLATVAKRRRGRPSIS